MIELRKQQKEEILAQIRKRKFDKDMAKRAVLHLIK